ncbi:unnamed protein product [Cutaneotrichosporon oleaginosum]
MPVPTPLTVSALAQHNGEGCVCPKCNRRPKKKALRPDSVVAVHGSAIAAFVRWPRPPPAEYRFGDETPTSAISLSSTGAVVNGDNQRTDSRRLSADPLTRRHRDAPLSTQRSTSSSRPTIPANPSSAPIPIPPPKLPSTRKHRDSLHPNDAYDVVISHTPRNSLEIHHHAYDRANLARRMSRTSISSPSTPPPPPSIRKRVRFQLNGHSSLKYPGY